MQSLVFATNNHNKFVEVERILGTRYRILSPRDIEFDQHVEEPFESLEENAREKAVVIKRVSGLDCFAEDTGLFVQALKGAPGVKTARYAGDHASDQDNIEKLLRELEGVDDRGAIFKTVVCLLSNHKEYIFEGSCEGNIARQKQGSAGFGYDPVFQPCGSPETFAEMGLEKKNYFSHRKKAIEKLVSHLSKQQATDLKSP